jgi:predicted HAD superfamily Cof-like phosphohydrolase
MYKALWQVGDFHRAFGIPIKGAPGFPSQERRQLRVNLDQEEFLELLDAESRNDLVGIADAIGDLIYVLLGHCLEYGIPIHSVFSAIHQSNMSKLGEGGQPLRREDGKILKGPNYQPPNLNPILELYGHRTDTDSPITTHSNP